MMKNNITEAEREYKRAAKEAVATLLAISLVVSLVLSTVLYYAFYHDYTVLRSSLFSVEIPVPINLIGAVTAATLLLEFGLSLILKRRLVLKHISDLGREYALKKADDEEKAFANGGKALSVGLLCIVLAIVAAGIMSVNCFGYNDSSVRFSDSHKIIVTTAELSDFELFRLEGECKNGKVTPYGGNAYGIVSRDGKRSYAFGNVSAELEQMLLSRYTTVKSAQTIDEAINYIKGE